MTGIVGDRSASTPPTRSGNDTRRRGWFWHWNNIVTQYAPMIGLKGVGLLNSYTVWTDRREESPHRGYAFPSQQREADFYGEDRAELITINKILVALDLIAIRKEMVYRTDEQGRRWKVPHNFYRVKDHGDDFNLSAPDVRRVVELADRDRAVYRYLRRMFSPRFAPIDGANVWNAILEELRPTEVWQRLAERTAKDEARASARSRAGHVSRRGAGPAAGADEPASAAGTAGDTDFFLPGSGDTATSVAPAFDSANDSGATSTTALPTVPQTTVAGVNTGSMPDVDGSNSGSVGRKPVDVAPGNSAQATSVEPGNRTYNQDTTTTTETNADRISEDDHGDAGFGPADRPRDVVDESTVVEAFEEANDRPSTPAERRMLRDLATRFEPVAADTGATGWRWLTWAIDDAVAAGSAFVAPRRIREILTRWERDGAPEEYAPNVPSGDRPSQAAHRPVTREPRPSHRSRVSAGTPPGDAVAAVPFVIESCGMSSRQIWNAVLGDLASQGTVGRSDIDTWMRESAIVGCTAEGTMTVAVPHEIARRRAAGRYAGPIRAAVRAVSGMTVVLDIVLLRDLPERASA